MRPGGQRLPAQERGGEGGAAAEEQLPEHQPDRSGRRRPLPGPAGRGGGSRAEAEDHRQDLHRDLPRRGQEDRPQGLMNALRYALPLLFK